MTAGARTGALVEPGPAAAKPIAPQDHFDELRTYAVRTLPPARGRVVRYIDAGEPDWRAAVFFGGIGTSVGAFSLTEFARSTRESLELRVVSIERNGFGDTPFDASRGPGAAVDDVLAVLSALAIERFSVIAISGGAPFAAALAARVPDRLISLHLAAAAAGPLTPRSQAAAALLADPAAIASDPRPFWDFPASSAVHRIPGFAAAAAREGVHAFGAGGGGAQALAHEWRLLCSEPLPDLRAVRAPTYLYAGASDELVPAEHLEAWCAALPSVVATRGYEGEGHDVQYRHWDQILVDAAGAADGTLVCQDGVARLVADGDIDRCLAGGAVLGMCAWAAGAGPRDQHE